MLSNKIHVARNLDAVNAGGGGFSTISPVADSIATPSSSFKTLGVGTDRAFVSVDDSSTAMQFYNISDPTNLILEGTGISGQITPRQIDALGNYGLAAISSQSFARVIDLTTRVIVSSLSYNNTYGISVIDDTYFLLSSFSSNVSRIYDWSNKTSTPIFVGNVSTATGLRNSSGLNTSLVTCTTSGRLFIIDHTTKSSPTATLITDAAYGTQSATKINNSENLATITNSGTVLVDISDHSSPVNTHTFTGELAPTFITDTSLITVKANTIYYWDVSDPSSPSLIDSSSRASNTPYDSKFNGNTLVVLSNSLVETFTFS